MKSTEVKALLEEHMPNSEVFIEGEGCGFRLTVVSDQFQGAMPVKRQQMVYHHLKGAIESGEIHAVNMTTLTHIEWQKLNR